MCMWGASIGSCFSYTAGCAKFMICMGINAEPGPGIQMNECTSLQVQTPYAAVYSPSTGVDPPS